MSGDMSMFKKMKERITDEVNSATNKLQNMQIIDQLASSIGQQALVTPNQLLPEPREGTSHHEQTPDTGQFSLIDDNPTSSGGGYNEEELNSDISPLQQLFDEQTIRKINSSSTISHNSKSSLSLSEQNGDFNPISNIDKVSSSEPSGNSENVMRYDNPSQTVIDIQDLSSDLEDALDEVNYDSTYLQKVDEEVVEIDLLSGNLMNENEILDLNKHGEDKYTTMLRKKLSNHNLTKLRTRYRNMVHAFRQLNRDLDKEKNKSESQIQELKLQITALETEIYNLKQQLNSTNQHDSLLSVSTNLSENDKSNSGSPQPTTRASSKIKDLERLLTKCKESLKQKNSQIQMLKDSLSEVEKFKDYNQELRRELGELRDAHETWTVSIAENKRVMHQELENKNAEIEKIKGEANEMQSRLNDRVRQLKSTIQDLESRLVSTSAAHQKERESLTKELIIDKNNAIRKLQKEHENHLERVKLDLEKSIEALKMEILNKDEQLIKSAEKFQQELHELDAKLTLMTTANDDQEKAIESLKSDRDALSNSQKSLKFEFDELIKKNESLSRVIRENETDMQTNQDQLDQFARVEKELDLSKKENLALLDSLSQFKTELNDRNSDLIQLRSQVEDLTRQNANLKADQKNTCQINDDLRKEKEVLISHKENSDRRKKELEEKLVVRILSAIRNLDTPTTSPGSDKSCDMSPVKKEDSESRDSKKDLPDPILLMDELSSVASDRCNSYVTATQRLQAVLLDNTMMSEELKRLKEEINSLNREKSMETQYSIDEAEKLRSENQALIHDQHSYDDQVKELQEKIEALRSELAETKGAKEAGVGHDRSVDRDDIPDSTQFEYLKNIVYQFMLGKEPLVLARVISAVFKFDRNQIEEICKIQEAVHSALKQSI